MAALPLHEQRQVPPRLTDPQTNRCSIRRPTEVRPDRQRCHTHSPLGCIVGKRRRAFPASQALRKSQRGAPTRTSASALRMFNLAVHRPRQAIPRLQPCINGAFACVGATSRLTSPVDPSAPLRARHHHKDNTESASRGPDTRSDSVLQSSFRSDRVFAHCRLGNAHPQLPLRNSGAARGRASLAGWRASIPPRAKREDNCC